MLEPNKRIHYRSDLSNKYWKIIAPHITTFRTNRGKKHVHSHREILNAIFYLLRPVVRGDVTARSYRGKQSITISVLSEVVRKWPSLVDHHSFYIRKRLEPIVRKLSTNTRFFNSAKRKPWIRPYHPVN